MDGGRILSKSLHDKEVAFKRTQNLGLICGAIAWVLTLFFLGPHYGQIYLCVTGIIGMVMCVRLAPKSKGYSGWSAFNKNGIRAAGEHNSEEIDSHLRGRPTSSGVGQFDLKNAYKPTLVGYKVGSPSPGGGGVGEGAPPPTATTTNSLLSTLAAEREARRRTTTTTGTTESE